MKGNNPTFQINATITNASTPYQLGETVTQSNSGATGKVENVYTDGTATIIHISKHTGSFTTNSADVISGGVSGATTSAIQSVTARSSATFGDSTFGAILSFNINNGGKNYVSPQLTVSGSSGVATGIVSASSGAINKAYVTNGGSGYRKQFSEGATIQITVSDTIVDSDNKFVDFSDKLLKCDTLSNVAIVAVSYTHLTLPTTD